MVTNNDSTPEAEAREEEEPTPYFWSDDGAARFNAALDEGGAYVQAGCNLPDDPESYLEEAEREYRDPELCDPDEESLPLGEMELIFENSFIN